MNRSNNNGWAWLTEVMESQNKELICIHFRDGRFKYLSPSVYTILGYKPEELEGTDPYGLIHPEDRLIAKENAYEPAVAGKKDSVTELRFRQKNGEYAWLQTITQPITNKDTGEREIYSSSRNITKDKEVCADLERLKRLFELTSKLSHVGGWETDLASMEHFWTEEMFDIFGLPGGEYPEESIKYIEEEYQGILISEMMRIVKYGGEYDLELPLRQPGGKRVWIRSQGKIMEREGLSNFLVGAVQDITEIKLREQRINRQNAELRELSASLSRQNQQLLEFSYIISHNLRGPVGNLVTLANFLRESEDEEDIKMVVEQVEESANVLNNTFEELMEVLKIRNLDKIHLERVSLRQVIDESLKLYEPALKDISAEVIKDFSELEYVDFSHVYLKSIAVNLISNAIKYRNPTRTLKLDITSGISGKGEKFIRFSDNGLGIDMKRFGEKVFRLHKTFHRHPDARGFGLFMTKNQVEALGGEISLESEVGKGSIFTIIFNPKLEGKPEMTLQL